MKKNKPLTKVKHRRFLAAVGRLIKQLGGTLEGTSQTLGCAKSTICYSRDSKESFEIEHAIRAELATGGKVKVEDLVPRADWAAWHALRGHNVTVTTSLPAGRE